MNRHHPKRPGYAARRATSAALSSDPALREVEARRVWGLLLSEARVLAGMAAEGLVERRAGDVLANLVSRPRPPFPQKHVSAQAGAEAFLILARAFVAGGFTPTLATFLREGAETLARLLDAETRAAFERSCAAAGRDD